MLVPSSFTWSVDVVVFRLQRPPAGRNLIADSGIDVDQYDAGPASLALADHRNVFL